MGMKAYYEEYWEDADFVDRDPTTAERKKRLVEVLSECCEAGDRVLDFGCGQGKFTALMQEHGYDSVGMDISAKAVEKAKKANPKGQYKVIDLEGGIPAENETFTAVWCTEVIEHVLKVDIFLEEINRVLKPGGTLILTTPYHGLIKNLLIVLFKFDRHFKVYGSHIRFFDKKALADSFERTDFEPLSYAGFGRSWPVYRSWFVVVRKSSRKGL